MRHLKRGRDPFLRLRQLRRTNQPRQGELDIFRLRDESLEESNNLPDPDILAQEIVEDLEAALEQFREIAVDLVGKTRRNEHHSQGAGEHRVCEGAV